MFVPAFVDGLVRFLHPFRRVHMLAFSLARVTIAPGLSNSVFSVKQVVNRLPLYEIGTKSFFPCHKTITSILEFSLGRLPPYKGLKSIDLNSYNQLFKPFACSFVFVFRHKGIINFGVFNINSPMSVLSLVFTDVRFVLAQ